MSGRQRIIVSQMLKFLKKEEDQYMRSIALMEEELVRLEMEEMKLKALIREDSEDQNEENGTADSSSVDENRIFSPYSDMEVLEENFTLSPVKSTPKRLRKDTERDNASNREKVQENEYSLDEMSLISNFLREESSDQTQGKEEKTAVCNSVNENCFLPCDSIHVEENFTSNRERFTDEDLKKYDTNCNDVRTGKEFQIIENLGSTDVQNSIEIEKMPLQINLQVNEEQIQDDEGKTAAALNSVNESRIFSSCFDSVIIEENYPSSLNSAPKFLEKQDTHQDNISNEKKFQENSYPESSKNLQDSTMAEPSESSMDGVRYLEPLILNPSHLEDDTLMEIEE